MRQLTLACCQYPIEPIGSLTAWRRKLDGMLASATEDGARLCLFPEYAAMELTAALPDDGVRPGADGEDVAVARAALATQLEALQALVPDYQQILVDLARAHDLWLVGPSLPIAGTDAAGQRVYHNQAAVIAPTGAATFVDKLQMTRFERELWGIAPGQRQLVVEADFGRFGVTICYDAEFPLISRRLADAGAELLLVPSCTDGLAGYHRVRVAAAARALENQLFVATAPTVGNADWSLAVDRNVGAAHVFCPPDRGLPPDGVVASGELDRPGWLMATIDLDDVARIRAEGQVLGHRDWGRPAHVGGPAPTAWP